jgi:hypothetical protein
VHCDNLLDDMAALVKRYGVAFDAVDPETNRSLVHAAPMLANFLFEGVKTAAPTLNRRVGNSTAMHVLLESGFQPRHLARIYRNMQDPRLTAFSWFDVWMSAMLKSGLNVTELDDCEGCTLVDIVLRRQPPCAFDREHVAQALPPLVKGGLNLTHALVRHRGNSNAIRTLVYAGARVPRGLLPTLVLMHGENAYFKLPDDDARVSVARDADGDCVPDGGGERDETAERLLDLRYTINTIARNSDVLDRVDAVYVAAKGDDRVALFLMLA